MKHVDENRCHDIDSLATQMMASVLDLKKNDYEWSNCSVMELNDFLRFFISFLFVSILKFKNTKVY